MAEKSIDNLLKKLSINVTENSKKRDSNARAYSAEFKEEIASTKFTIFTPISDCGYYKWNPTKYPQYKPLSEIQSSKDIIRHISVEAEPMEILPLSQLRVPRSFIVSLPPNSHSNQYPFGQYDVASLYVATKYRNVEMDEIDFIFGGSTLEMLANCDTSDPYMVCRVPTTTNTYFVRKCKEYVQNCSDIGFQFERYVTTGNMNELDDVEFIEHMQVMQIGTNFKVLICAEADACDDNGNPIEVKASNPRYWGTKVMFQMISSGSTKLCHGVKGRNELTNIRMRSLTDVTSDALRDANCYRLEQNILNGMKVLQEEMKDAKDGDVYKISFDSIGHLHLQRAITRNAVLLPPTKIVEELLGFK